MNSRGFLIYADGEQYLEQAYLCALSIIKNNNKYPISLVTNNNSRLYEHVFDKIIDIPNYEESTDRFSTKGRKELYWLSPYDETIVLDSDVLVLTNLEHFWDLMVKDIYYPSTVYTYRGEIIQDSVYRTTFIENSLENCYNAFCYFRKSKTSEEFYNLQKIIVDNWQEFYKIWCPLETPKQPSMDVVASIALKIQNITTLGNISPHMVHMKPAIQGWQSHSDSWLERVSVFVNEKAKLKVGNYQQNTIFHYTDNNFVTEEIIRKFENV